ncbi:MAG: hypothetical protein KJ882_09335 [Proteobacteria bacterium]|nr:hypothetical protein [Pseudomonadota bacterium]MBU4010957.1 hypothetical protein [Pseudomonadota bacterium]
MLCLIRKTMFTGIGFALKTWDEVENKANEIAQKSKMSEKEGQESIRDIRKWFHQKD